jgi:subtilisin family serine protease
MSSQSLSGSDANSSKRQKPLRWQRLERLNTPSPIVPLSEDLDEIFGESPAAVEPPLPTAPIAPEVEPETVLPDLEGGESEDPALVAEVLDGGEIGESSTADGEFSEAETIAESEAAESEPVEPSEAIASSPPTPLSGPDPEGEIIEFVPATSEATTESVATETSAPNATSEAPALSSPEATASTDPLAASTGEGESGEAIEAEAEIDDPEDGAEAELLTSTALPEPDPRFQSGIFTVGGSGQVVVDVLWDGGAYRGQAGIFSLSGMESYELGSVDFIAEMARRVTSESVLGYVIWNDPTEAARFSGVMNGEADFNSGAYAGLKSFEMQAGDKFGVVLVPDTTFVKVLEQPWAEGSWRPLFSMVTANPNDSFQMGQIADVTGDGNTFTFEDIRVDHGGDKDYNDFIFQVRGATGEAVLMDEVVAPGKDWRGTDAGQLLVSYAKQYVEAPIEGGVSPSPDGFAGDDGLLPAPPLDFKPSAGEALPNPADGVLPDGASNLPGPLPTYTETRFEFPAENQPVIGIIDTGFAGNNPDFNFSNITWGKDYVSGDLDPTLAAGEGSQHGTHILGVIAAQQDNGVGIDGINPDAPIFATRAIGNGAWAEALTDTVDHIKASGQPNGVVNLSLDLTQRNPDVSITTRYEFTPEERVAIEYARQNGVVLVVAAGNDGGVMSVLGQASQEFDNIVTVSAVERANGDVSLYLGTDRVDYASYGDGLTVVADGGTPENPVLSTVDDGVGTMAGTSVATARVTGVVSQIWAANPDLSYRQVIDILKQTATDFGATGWDTQTGAGLVNLAAAIHLAKITAAEPDVPDEPGPDNDKQNVLNLPDTVWFALQRAENLSNYDPADLASTRQWVVNVKSGENIGALSNFLNAKLLGKTKYIENTYILEFPDSFTSQEIQQMLKASGQSNFAYPLVSYQQESRFVPNDSLFVQQWHLQNQGQSGGTAGEDSNLVKAWEQGVTGQRVVIGIVDDGLQYTHPDLQPNYRADLSRDFNEQLSGGWGTYDHDPRPNNSTESHGTAVAGVAAAKGNNSIGGTGAAPNAGLAGLRLTANASNDVMEADALSYLSNSIHIYNNSWGPTDDGSTKKAPGPLTAMALHLGATAGRGGLGNMYVWSGGNGKEALDNVNYDGYANSRYTVAVAAIDQYGRQSYYSEPGSSLLISAYSSGNKNGIITTDLIGTDGYSQGDYTNNFGGTSSAASLVSGVIALVLEANPSLTWRDVQKILIDTARKNDPGDGDWKLNGGGYWVNHKYGFGVIDADSAVELAKSWKPLGTEVKISSGRIPIKTTIPDNNTIGRTSTVKVSEEMTIETVEVMVDSKHTRRGDLEIRLISPDGTTSVLSERHSDTGSNYENWVFTSTRHWGESSKGDWKLQVTDRRAGTTGTWESWQLNLYGAKPTISIEATTPNSAEGEGSGEFIVTRTGSTKYPLTINYELRDGIHWSEPAGVNGKDFATLPGTITIPAGSSSVKIPVVPINDEEPEWTETVNLKLVGSSQYEVSSNSGATVKLFDNEKPRIQLLTEWAAATPGPWHQANYVSESGNVGLYLFRRLGDIRNTLTVDYTMSGSAINGLDYQLLPGSITFQAGSFDAAISPTAIDDSEIEGEETAILTITPSSSYNIVPNWGSHPTVIWDNDDKPSVNMFASVPKVSEYGQVGTIRVTRTGDTSQPLTVHYWEREWWLRATPGQDYENIPGTARVGPGNHLDGTVAIPAGQSSVDINITPVDDNEVEPTEWVRFLLRSSPDYTIAGEGGATLSIVDNDTPKIDWQRQLGTSGYDYSEAVTLDSLGNTYIAGRTSANLAGINLGSYDAWLAKYDAGGTEIWKQQLGTAGYDAAKGIVADRTGNLYVTGWTDGSLDGNAADRDAWLTKYDFRGQLIWRKQIRVASNPDLADYDISNGSLAIGNDGSVYLTGLTHAALAGASQGDADAWVAKYDSNGNQQWVRQIGTPQRDEARGVVVDAGGFVYITGQTKGALGATSQGDADAWIAKYDSQGSLLWKRQLGTQTEDASNGIAVDSNGNVSIVGYTRNKLGDPFTENPTELGDSDLRWAAIHGDQSGLGGTYYGNADAWVAQYDSNGNLKWKRQLGTSQYDAASAVSTDQFGNVYLTGKTRGKLGQSYSGGDDIWVAKYNINGALQWIQQLGTNGEDAPSSLAVGSTALYITGSTSGSLSVANQGGDDAWLIKLS